jgi:hypothetical protein
MNNKRIRVNIMPRQSMTWKQFLDETPNKSIALDGYCKGGPNFDCHSHHSNFDHHEGVVREATMSTCMQVYYAIKGGLMNALMYNCEPINVYINDTDQDTSLAVWLLLNYKQFEGTQSIPHINRLLALTDKLDITGGAFPMNLDDQLIRQHGWIFQPYQDLRKSGMLATADCTVLMNNLETVNSRITQFMMNQGGEIELDTRHKILHDCPQYKIVDEIGGNDARYYLFSKGLDAFISLVATRPDGYKVYTVGKRSQYIQFPIRKLYEDYNLAEGLNHSNGWNGSDIIGGSSREHASKLEWNELKDLTNLRLELEGML